MLKADFDLNSADQFWAEIYQIIVTTDIEEKTTRTADISNWLDQPKLTKLLSQDSTETYPIKQIPLAGYPHTLRLVAPRELPKRRFKNQDGRNILMHALAHIEFNAINLALDAAYRFRDVPAQFTLDWIAVAADEARHFLLVNDYLKAHGCQYGDFAAHNGLWEMVVKTQDDIVARMALVPRVLEARGLDVSPAMIARLEQHGDRAAADVVKVIYQDEIGHVKIGSHWFEHCCKERDLEPRTTFKTMIKRYLHGELRGPFNLEARGEAGFSDQELQDLVEQYG